MRLQKSFLVFPLFLILIFALSACEAAAEDKQTTSEASDLSVAAEPTEPMASETSERVPISLEPIVDRNGCEVSAPPAELGLDEFYTKYCDADGIIVAASDNVDDFAVKEGWYVVMNFLAPLPDARASLAANGAQLTIYDINREELRDVPEYYTLSFDTNEFAVGLGGTLSNPVSVTTEQDLLCNRTTTYRITIHEMAHMLRDMYLLPEQRGFLRAQNDAFVNAFTSGLWEGAYARENADENWAEGVNAYFGTYRDAFGTRYVRDRESLADYDPKLFGLIDEVFVGYDWMPSCASFSLFN